MEQQQNVNREKDLQYKVSQCSGGSKSRNPTSDVCVCVCLCVHLYVPVDDLPLIIKYVIIIVLAA